MHRRWVIPISNAANLPSIWEYAERLQPTRILDIGIGVGLVGAGLRNYLDGRWGRVQPKDWQIVIEGIEGFAAYENPCWAMYNRVTVADFSKPEVYETITGWPLVLALDCLEHLPKTEALAILTHLAERNKNVIVSVPIGHCPQNACFGNPFEEHKSTWTGDEFSIFNGRVLYRGECQVVAITGLA